MKLIGIFAVISAIGVFGDDLCDYGGFDRVNDTCMYNCNWDNVYIDIEDLSFETIMEECDNVEQGYANGICTGVGDLVYRNDSCECPYCKCTEMGSTLVEEISYDSDSGPSKQCENCTCSEPDWWMKRNGITDLIYQCNYLINADNPQNWEFYECPPNQCVYNETSEWGGWYTNEFTAGDVIWPNVEDDSTECTEFCYCPSSGDPICTSGYDNILGDETTAYLFDNRCDYYLRGVKCPLKLFLS